MIEKTPTIYKSGDTVKITDFFVSILDLANDWEDITSEFSVVSPFVATQTLKILYSQSLSCILFDQGGSFKQTSAISGFAWNAFLKYNGTKFTNASLFKMPKGYNAGITLFNSLNTNGDTNGYASIPNYFNSGGFNKEFVFKLFMSQTSTYGVQFNKSLWYVS